MKFPTHTAAIGDAEPRVFAKNQSEKNGDPRLFLSGRQEMRLSRRSAIVAPSTKPQEEKP
jgi:hypothetical protein